MSKLVISFSLFLDPKWKCRHHEYLLGVLANVQARDRYFSDFELWFFTDVKLKHNPIIRYVMKQYDRVKFLFKPFRDYKEAVQWRFIPIFHRVINKTMKAVLVRDVDSVLTELDAHFITTWLNNETSPPLLLYREYIMSYLVCGGGFNIHFSRFRELLGNRFDFVQYTTRLNPNASNQDYLNQPRNQETSMDLKLQERGYDERKLDAAVQNIPESYRETIILRMDVWGRYQLFRHPAETVFEIASLELEIEFLTEHRTESKENFMQRNLKYYSKCPDKFIWPNSNKLEQLSELYTNSVHFRWLR